MEETLRKDSRSFYYRRMLTVTIPVVIQNLLNIGLNMADTVMIGRLGELELAATGAGNQAFNIFASLCFGFYSGAGVFVAQYFGAKNIRNIRRIVGFDIIVGLVIASGFLAAVQIMPEGVIRIFTDDPQVISEGVIYVRIVSFSYVMTALSFAVSFNSRAIQRLKAPTVINASALIMNCVLNYILIYGKLGAPALGVKGAALATLIARGYEMAALFAYVILVKDHPLHAAISEYFRRDVALYKNVVRTAMPVVFSEGGWSLGMTLVFATYGLIGPSALAVIQVASMTGQIFQSVIFGFGNGASVVVGETLGRRCVDEAVEHSSRTIRIALVMIVIMVAGIISVINPVSELYGFGAETTLLLKKTIAVYAFTMMPRMMSYVLQCGILRAGGDTLFCMVTELLGNLVIELIMAYTAVVFLGWPLYMCIALASLGNVFKMTANYLRYRSRKWINIVI